MASKKPAAAEPVKLPRTAPKSSAKINDLINAAAAKREEVAEAERNARLLKSELDEIETLILDAFVRDGTESQRAKNGAMFTVRRDTVPTVEDWPAVDAWILKHKALDLMQRRLGVTAWREHMAAGHVIPGIVETQVIKLAYSRPKA